MTPDPAATLAEITPRRIIRARERHQEQTARHAARLARRTAKK